jgi:pimeloyl-ACP methyl ester carboxylesterase
MSDLSHESKGRFEEPSREATAMATEKSSRKRISFSLTIRQLLGLSVAVTLFALLPSLAMAGDNFKTDYAIAHDGTKIYFEVHGEGPALLLFANPKPPPELEATVGSRAQQLIDDLADRYKVVLMDYPGVPKPDTLTPDNVVRDLLAIADAAGVDRFAWWGFSWGGVIGLQLAIRTDRLTALVMSGFPPIDGPYAEMLTISMTLSTTGGTLYELKLPPMGDSARQYVTFYEQLQNFDDRAIQSKITCPRLTYIGDVDRPTLNGKVLTDMGATVVKTRAELEELGWEVRINPGKSHLDYSPAETSAILASFFDRHLLRKEK